MQQHRQQCLIRIALIFHKLKLLCGDNESSSSVGGQTVLTFDEISGEFIAKLMPSSPPPAGDDDSRSSEVQDEVTAIKRVNSGEDDKSSSSSSDSEDVIVEEEESEEECDEDAASSEIKLLKVNLCALLVPSTYMHMYFSSSTVTTFYCLVIEHGGRLQLLLE